jgi:N-acetylglutamate synthase-like GNAT family acetyltransferase
MLAYAHSPHLIRRAEIGDLALLAHLRIARLWCIELNKRGIELVAAHANHDPVDRDSIEAGRYLVAEHCGTLLAGCGWEPVGEDGARLTGLVLDLDHGANSIAARVVACVETEAARAGRARVEVRVPRSVAASFRMLGYEPGDNDPSDAERDAGIVLVHMRKDLPLVLADVA